MDLQKEREAFEAWFESRYDAHFMQFALDLDMYADKHTQTCWEAWQAAKAQAVPEWINVNLLSPQVDTEVLVCVGDDVKTAIYRDLDGEGYFEGVFGAKWWMPKPKAQEPAND